LLLRGAREGLKAGLCRRKTDGRNAYAGEAIIMTQQAGGDAERRMREAAYWRATVRLTLSLLAIWFAASFGLGILFREALDQIKLGGAPLGFWFAQQGSIYIFVVLIFYYCFAMARLERRFRIKG
jgi:putative solute:sodium symporter small subunit